MANFIFVVKICTISLLIIKEADGIDKAFEILNQSTVTIFNTTEVLVATDAQPVTWPSDANDSCVENALERWYEGVRRDFYQYTELTASMFSSRLLYQSLFTLSFDPSSLGRYCQLYKSIREESDRCPNSPNKGAILNGFALGDYFCLERMSDYITTMPCLSKQELVGSFSACGDDGDYKCSEYDSAPYVYTNPNDGSNDNDTLLRMSLDCRYLQCDIDCRYPVIVKQCGKISASFVLDSLGRVFVSIWTGLKTEAQTLWAAFPDDCRKLMQVAKQDAVNQANVSRTTAIGANTSVTTTTTQTWFNSSSALGTSAKPAMTAANNGTTSRPSTVVVAPNTSPTTVLATVTPPKSAATKIFVQQPVLQFSISIFICAIGVLVT